MQILAKTKAVTQVCHGIVEEIAKMAVKIATTEHITPKTKSNTFTLNLLYLDIHNMLTTPDTLFLSLISHPSSH
jgi:hypothetical protein